MRYRTEKLWIPAGDRKMKLLVLRPAEKKASASRTGVLWLHGGGYVTGMPEMVHFTRARDLVSRYGAVVFSPSYRLAGKAPYPAALEDCHAALRYMKEHAEKLGIRSDQLMVGGESAGGGLAAALCMYEKDIGGVKIAFQMPLYPMIDDRDTETSGDNHAPVWNTRRNHKAWKKYLGGLAGHPVPCYAAPARRKAYAGLPPAYTFVSTAEPFYAETAAYMKNLQEAGVRAEMDVYPGLFHAFDMLLPFLKISRIAAKNFGRQFVRARKHFFAAQEQKKADREETL